MVSATDIITYIGVPLAVLGVAPIFYTFASALYARLKFGRILRRNDFAPRIRARIMTGVVEVDLPVLQLFTLSRDQSQYWQPSASPKTVGGASWSAYNFNSREVDVVTCRLQRSDKITLPEAKINFKSLLDFLLDLDCYPDLDGFKELRTRGQNAVGASLMCIRGSQLNDRSSRTVLVVAKPGDRDGLFSLKLENIWSSRKPAYGSNLTKYLPPFCLTGPLLELEQPTTSLETNKVASTAMTPGESIDSGSGNASREKRHYFFIAIGDSDSDFHVSIHETPAPSSITIMLSPDHLNILRPDLTSEDTLIQRDSWRDWFACAAIAVYGFQERRPFHRYLPNQRDVQKVQSYDIKVNDAIHYGLIDVEGKPYDERLEVINTSSVDTMNTIDDTGGPRPIQSTDRRRGISMAKEDFLILKNNRRTLKRRNKIFGNFDFSDKAEIEKFSSVFEKHVAMPNLLRLCLGWLISNPIQFESLVIGSLPNESWDLNQLAQHTSDLIVRMIILDFDFAKEVKLQIDSSLNAQANPLDKKKQDIAVYKILVGISSPETSRHFCCAMVLLAIIGQRAEYLLSGKDVKHCENKLGDVYVS